MLSFCRSKACGLARSAAYFRCGNAMRSLSTETMLFTDSHEYFRVSIMEVLMLQEFWMSAFYLYKMYNCRMGATVPRPSALPIMPKTCLVTSFLWNFQKLEKILMPGMSWYFILSIWSTRLSFWNCRETFASVESVKAASDVYAPVTGTVVAVNEV